jgi:hypothetical protein
MKKHAVIFIALLFSFNPVAGTSASGNSDCASKCSPQPAKSGQRHASGEAVRLMHLNCCSGNTAYPCELGSHRKTPMPDCSLATHRTKAPNSTTSSLISHLIAADGFTSSLMGIRAGTRAAGKAPPLYLQNLSILC